MKTKIFTLLVLIVGASCSAPKYTYNFSYYDYQAGKRAAQKEAEIAANKTTSTEVVASTMIVPTATETTTAPIATKSTISTPINTKVEQKAFVKEVKKEIKNAVRQVKKMNSIQTAQAMDHDLKLAAIFGAIGIALQALWGVSNIFGFAGAVCIIIGLVFLIKWLLRQ
jgi:Flp pilus assembly protein TadB